MRVENPKKMDFLVGSNQYFINAKELMALADHLPSFPSVAIVPESFSRALMPGRMVFFLGGTTLFLLPFF